MFIKLKNKTHIDATRILSIVPEGQGYLVTLSGGSTANASAEEFPWLMKICGFLVELKSASAINLKEITLVSESQITLRDGQKFDVVADELSTLWTECGCMDLQARIAFLESKNVPCEDYKKL